MRLELFLMSRELQRILLVWLCCLERVYDDLIEHLQANHKQAKVRVAAFEILIVEKTCVRYNSRKEESLLDS